MKINFGSLYKTYEKQFYEAKRSAKKLGLPMANPNKLTRTEFEYAFDASRRFLVDKGKEKPTNREVLNELVDRQQYSGTEKQGKALAKAMRERGYDIDTREARAYFLYVKEDEIERISPELRSRAKNIQNFYNEQKNYAAELKALGYSTTDISRMIAVMFYGSE